MTKDIIWKSIKLSPQELTISRVLRCGQAFRWKFIDGIWSCSIKNRILLLKQDPSHLHFSSLPYLQDTESVVHDYFNLSISLNDLYKTWSAADPQFNKHSKNFQGIRMLRQDPWENLISFICSTNNNVKRISKMCDSLCTNYGTLIGEYQGHKHYSFPTPSQLSKSDNLEQELRGLGFGYRAKYIEYTSNLLTNKQTFEKLYGLRNESSLKKCHEELLAFKGVGPKVADCVLLMSLDKHHVVPVDTHVFQIAVKNYKFGNKKKATSLNKELYSQIQTYFHELWGDYAGWAHSVLFAADLKDLNNGVNENEGDGTVKSEKQVTIKGEEVEFYVKVEQQEEVLSESQVRRMQRYEKRSWIKSEDTDTL